MYEYLLECKENIIKNTDKQIEKNVKIIGII